MNENIRSAFQKRLTEAADGVATTGGPWDFRFIRSLKSLERFEDVGGCVMLASPGMMQNGVSRALLERWAPDSKNGVVVTGYSVEGTMAKLILTEPESIQATMTARQSGVKGMTRNADEKVMVPRRCTVQEFSFAAHVDGTENREFVEEVAAPVVVSHLSGNPGTALLTLLDPGTRREDKHDAIQVQIAITQCTKGSAGESVLPGKQ